MDPSDRIIGHMNKDHQLALIDYLVVYNHVVGLDESTPAITHVDLDKLTLKYVAKQNPGSFTIKWDDANEDENISVKEWSDVKGKLIAMAKYTAHKQGFAHTRLTKVYGPSGASAIAYPITLFFALNIYDVTLLPRIFANDSFFLTLVGYLPELVTSAYGAVARNSLKIALAVFSIHILEILKFTVPIIREYRAPFSVSARWIAMHFFEGFPVIGRIREAIH